MYNGFFGMAALSLLPVAHGVYRWRQAGKNVPRRAKVFLIVLAALYGCAVAAGAMVVLIGAEPAASHVAGLTALVLALWFDYRFNRIGTDPGKEEV